MKILLTGVTGYIGKRLLPTLLRDGHQVICAVRDLYRFDPTDYKSKNLSVIRVNFLDKQSLSKIPRDIDAAYYLIHSMSSSTKNFSEMEAECARNFVSRINQTKVKQVIYLSGIINADHLSKHLKSRESVEKILAGGRFNLTTLRAGIVVGSGSASFEIIRDLVEKLPVMIAPKWVNTRSQPIAVSDVIQYLRKTLLFEKSYQQSFDIGGPDIMTYKQILLEMAQIRKLRRFILSVPFMTPKLSSYWLYFMTSTSYKLAVNLVNSMKVEIICKPNQLSEWLGIELMSYQEAVIRAFDKIAQQEVISSWTDALNQSELEQGIAKFLKLPVYGCLSDRRCLPIDNEQQVLNNIMSIGGDHGWYYADWLWQIRGFMDKLIGGVGLRRGRKNPYNITTGETLDFWRVLFASRKDQRLLLYAEMKLPGEAWLEWRIHNRLLFQTATFRPRGIWGRIYWYILYPFHLIIFHEMMKRITTNKLGPMFVPTKVNSNQDQLVGK